MKKLEIKVAALIMENDKVLLIKEWNATNHQYSWNLVKGSFDYTKDNSIFDAVTRECEEEVNIKIKIKKLINVIYYRNKDKIRIQFNFLCQGLVKKAFLSNLVEQKSRNEDINEIKLFTKSQLKVMKEKEFMNKRIWLTIKDFLKGNYKDLSTIREIIEL